MLGRRLNDAMQRKAVQFVPAFSYFRSLNGGYAKTGINPRGRSYAVG